MTDPPNPFSTKFIRPGAIPYHRHDGGTLLELVERFDRDCVGWASIIGDHGSGKSTLLESLRPIFEETRRVFCYRLRSDQRRLLVSRDELREWTDGCLVIVDGYEQMSLYESWRLRRKLKLAGCQLLVTAHRRIRGIPILWSTSVDEATNQRLLCQLMDSYRESMADEEFGRAWHAARLRYPTNVRECLFAMYDWFEAQKTKTARK